MNRHLRIVDFAISNLSRHRGKTLVVVSVYSLLVGLLASLLMFVDVLQTEAQRLFSDAPEIVVQRIRGGRHELAPTDWATPIREIRGVSAATPRVWGYYYDPPTGATFTFWGAETVPAGSLEIVAGEGVSDDDPRKIIVGRGVADIRFLDIGTRLPVKRSDGELFAPRVSGIFTAESALLTHDLIVMPSDQLRLVFGMGDDLCTDIAVEVTNPEETATVTRKIQQAWPDARVISRGQILQTYDALFDWRGGLWIAVLSGAIAAFAILVWDKATGLSAEEYRTIGLLRAVGWTTRNVMELRLCEGGIVSSISLLTGFLLAHAHLLWLDGLLYARVLKGWSAMFPSFDLAPRLSAQIVFLCLVLAVIPYVTAGLVPAWRAAITDPDSVIRS